MRRVGLVMAVLLTAGALFAQQTNDKHEQARQRFAALSKKMQELQVVLSTTAPEESRLLKVGNRHVQEARIQEDMEGISALLKDERWDEALERMNETRQELEELLALLQAKDLDLKKLLEEIERLSAFKDRVEKLIDEQAREKRASADVEALEQHLRDLEAAKAKVQDLLNEQTKLRDATNQAGLNVQPKAAEEMAGKQGELKKQAEELADQLDRVAKEAEKLDANKEAKDGENKAGEKSGENKPSDAKQGKPADNKPAEAKPTDGKPKDGEAKPSESKDGKPGSCSSCSGSCSSAAKSMQQAQQKLEAKKPESSLEDQNQAIAKLKEALGDLDKLSEEARRKLLQIPFENQIKAQEATRVETDKLAQDMEASEKGEDAKPTPGKKNVQQAPPKQKAAAGQLKERKPGKAKQDQQDAEDELQEAKKELEDALAQLRQEMQDQVLRALEERLAAMLAKQREISALTKVTDRLKAEAVAADGVPASIRERCGRESKGEAGLASESHDAIKLLEEDGTTAVYPALFEEIERDLKTIADRLAQFESGAGTQEMQRNVEEMMSTLLEALRKQIEEGQGQCNGSCNGQPPLVPLSAELKVLMQLQKTVAKRTKDFDKAVPAEKRDTADAKLSAGELSRKQGRVEELARKLANQLNKNEEAREAGGK